LYNTLSKDKEVFTLPAPAKSVRMYNCGPTVYGKQHIGNLSMFVFTDVLRRVLQYNGFRVKQVINITDVGHLTSDADEGDDKMTKGLKRENMQPTLANMRKLADKYTDIFMADLKELNVHTDDVTFPRASDYIDAQIAMIETLQQKGYAYKTDDGVYYDTSRFADYGLLGGINLEGLKEGARVESRSGKRHATDFALWKLDPHIGWDSPWGKGFPGWHIECSAMIRKTLGEQIDIHTGGIEHISIHHNNEIAQSEAVTGKKPLARFWMHRAHVQIDKQKIAKSDGNVVYLADVIERGYHPLALRYLFLGAHYRTSANFSWDALDASQTAYLRLRTLVRKLPEGGTAVPEYQIRIVERLNDDLDTPGALSVIWELTKDAAVRPADMRATIAAADGILGLKLVESDELADAMCGRQFGVPVVISELPEEVQLLLTKREEARSDKNWVRSDELRAQLGDMGYDIEDSQTGARLTKK
jgi:cysteinyl-tRNA synthetase